MGRQVQWCTNPQIRGGGGTARLKMGTSSGADGVLEERKHEDVSGYMLAVLENRNLARTGYNHCPGTSTNERQPVLAKITITK